MSDQDNDPRNVEVRKRGAKFDAFLESLSRPEREFLIQQMSTAACYSFTPREKMIWLWMKSREYFGIEQNDVA